MKPLLAFSLSVTLFAVLPAQSGVAQPLNSGIDPANFDTSVRPQDDLFRAINGTWLAKTEIPADRADYGAFAVLAEQAEKDLLAILEDCANAHDEVVGSESKKIGDLYVTLWSKMIREYSDIFVFFRMGDDLGYKTSTMLAPAAGLHVRGQIARPGPAPSATRPNRRLRASVPGPRASPLPDAATVPPLRRCSTPAPVSSHRSTPPPPAGRPARISRPAAVRRNCSSPAGCRAATAQTERVI